tara:strand:+ start:9128 stop:9682 length:555 start_codon:yes stop_codon:yes gene_type:complete
MLKSKAEISQISDYVETQINLKEIHEKDWSKKLACDKIMEIIELSPHYKKRKSNMSMETPEQYFGRMIWYLYVANVTAYNLQYRETQSPVYDDLTESEHWTNIITKTDELVSEMRSLLYNVFTNDGNVFVADGWVETFTNVIKFLELVVEKNIAPEKIELVELEEAVGFKYDKGYTGIKLTELC